MEDIWAIIKFLFFGAIFWLLIFYVFDGLLPALLKRMRKRGEPPK